MSTHRPTLILIVAFWGITARSQQSVEASESDRTSSKAVLSDKSGLDKLSDKPVLPALAITPVVSPILPEAAANSPETESGVKWADLYRSSSAFLSLEHGLRLLTEPGTRSGLKGSRIRNYARSVANLHGWADGDPFYVNYVGHPMQGGVAGFLWTQNDLAYRRAEFGTDPMYWKARFRAAAFIWAYSTVRDRPL